MFTNDISTYYLYGLPTHGSKVSITTPYLYGGKEFENRQGLNLYDFHARTYAPDECRFWQPDPKATENHGVSPYIFCNGDPINFVDPDGKLPFDKSVVHTRISSVYGLRKDPFTGEQKGHTGIDLSTDGTGHNVHVVADGTIKKIGWDYKLKDGEFKGYGRYVVVAHADGYETLYAHLEKNGVMVSVGDVVSENDVIAKSGNTGRSTGPHLHIEFGRGNILDKDNKIDPASIPDLQTLLHPDFRIILNEVVAIAKAPIQQPIVLPITLDIKKENLQIIVNSNN